MRYKDYSICLMNDIQWEGFVENEFFVSLNGDLVSKYYSEYANGCVNYDLCMQNEYIDIKKVKFDDGTTLYLVKRNDICEYLHH